jgi:hypothetical protein
MPIPLHDYSITVSGAPYKYDPALQMEFEATVANAIIRGQIAKTAVGKLVLSRIKNGPGDVEIYPRYKTGLNAEADYQLKSNSSGRLIGRDPHKIVVWFKPQQWKETLPASHATIPTNLRAFQPGMLRDEVLLHELVHSGRLLDGFAQVSHKLAPNPDDVAPYANADSAAYENIEEFMTILVSNIYLSEKGQKVFRASHGGDGYPYILDQAQSSSEGFLSKKSNLALVKFFCETDRLAPKLVAIDTPFNPVRAFFIKNPLTYTVNGSLNN